MDEIVLSCSIQAMLREKIHEKKRQTDIPKHCLQKLQKHNWDRNTARNVMKRNEIVMMVRGVISRGEGYGH